MEIKDFLQQESRNEIVKRIIKPGYGSNVGTEDEQIDFYRRNFAKQWLFLDKLGTREILWEVNAKLLRNTGGVGIHPTWGGTDVVKRNIGTIWSLVIDPRKYRSYPDVRQEAVTPILDIGLFGDALKMANGEDNFMTHLAVTYRDSESQEARKAFAESRLRKYKITDVNPSLDLDQFTPKQWEKLRRRTKKRAIKILNEKIHENDPDYQRRRRIKRVAIGIGAAVGTAVVGEAVNQATNLIPKLEQLFQTILPK